MVVVGKSDFIFSRIRIPRPFLKWVGGKSQLLTHLLGMIPKDFRTYHEPFVGGGALYFELAPSKAILSDLNRELIDCYTAVQGNVEKVITALKRHRYDKEYYYEIRGQDPFKLSPVKRAARMIYLNRTGFNGLYRVNSKGEFNVPFGRYKDPLICDESNLRACSEQLRRVELKRSSFEKVLKHARERDLVYFDPPYIPLSDTAYFTAYEKSGFGMSNQERLAEVFDELAERGVYVILSNSDVPWMRSRYRAHSIHSVKALRNINSKGDKRGRVGELIVTSFSID